MIFVGADQRLLPISSSSQYWYIKVETVLQSHQLTFKTQKQILIVSALAQPLLPQSVWTPWHERLLLGKDLWIVADNYHEVM